MKIGVVNRAGREDNTGFTSFESGIIPHLLEDDRFIPINYNFHGGVRAITSEIRLGRKVRKADKKRDLDVIFVPTHTQMMNIDQSEIDAQVVPYIHDMLVLSAAYYNFIYNLKGRMWLPNVKKCDFIFSASEFTADDLRKRGGYKGDIEVVYQGIGFETAEDPKSYEEREYDLLYVGEMIERKDPETLREVAELAEEKGLKMAAVNREELDLPCETFVDLTNEELRQKYENSRYYIHPSLVEGFGRCPVEAQSQGAVPIARDNSINDEILQDSYLEFAIAEQVISHVKEIDDTNWKTYSEKSLKNSERFDFKNTRQKIKDRLVKLANESE